jgi:hypothetical protein
MRPAMASQDLKRRDVYVRAGDFVSMLGNSMRDKRCGIPNFGRGNGRTAIWRPVICEAGRLAADDPGSSHRVSPSSHVPLTAYGEPL